MTRHVRPWAIAVLAVFALAGAAPRSLAGIMYGTIYTVTNDTAHQNEWTLAGTITVTNLGTFSDARQTIRAWDITASKGLVSHQFTNTGSTASFSGAGSIMATADTLSLGNGSRLQFFVDTGYTSQLRWTDNNDQSVYYAGWEGAELWFSGGDNSTAFSPSVGGVWTLASGGTPISIPEIDPAGIGSVLALVTGAIGLLERRRLKTA